MICSLCLFRRRAPKTRAHTHSCTDARSVSIFCTVHFISCVAHSVAGVTGVRPALPDNLKNLVGRVRAATDKPVSVGFGISSEANVKEVAAMADGVIVGSAFMKAIDKVGKPLWQSGRGRGGTVILHHSV